MLETKKWLKIRAGVYQKYSTLPDLCEAISIKTYSLKYGYVKKKDLIRSIYKKILDYAIKYEQEDEFQENWMGYFTEDDYHRGRLSAVFRSVIIESYLKE